MENSGATFEPPSGEAIDGYVAFNIENMAFPASPAEAETLAKVIALPRVTVSRVPNQYLLAMGMAPYDCHRNCSSYAGSDPDGILKHVWGWIIEGSDLILHSVVERNGVWRCLTPQYIDAPARFTFVPDMVIEWRDNTDGSRTPYRDGIKLPDTLRKYPDDHIRMRDRFRELINSGVSVPEARSIVEATLWADFVAKPGI